MPDEPEIKPFPSVFRMAWLLLMQPITFRREMQACGIQEPDASGWALWRGGEKFSRQFRVIPVPAAKRKDYAWKMAGVFCLLLFPTVMVAAGVNELFRQEPSFGRFIGLFAFGLTFGVTTGVSVGVAVSVVFGVVFGVAFGVTTISGTTGAFTGAFTGSVAISVANGVARGVTFSVARGIAFSVAAGVALSVAAGAREGVTVGITAGIGVGVVFSVGIFRVVVYPFECALSLFCSARVPASALRHSPVFFHELSYLSLPFLEKQMLAVAETDPVLVRRCLEACRIAPGQRRIGRRVEAELAVREMLSLIGQGRFTTLAEMDGTWLPSGKHRPKVVVWVQEAARYLAAAQSASNAHTGLRQMEQFTRLVTLPSNRPGADRDAKAEWEWMAQMPRLVAALISAGEKIEGTLKERARNSLPNPFQPNKALRPDLEADLFRGRSEVVGVVGRLLADPVGGASITLLAPRRTGKSTLLHMLPALVPDAFFVFCDIMEMPSQTLAGFLNYFDDALRDAALKRQVENVPRMEDSATVESFGRWIKALDEAAGERRILFCIDEFERLEGLWPGTERDLLQFMGLLRATIQNRRRVRLLVSGAAPFDELGSIWRDHFINNRELRLGYFDEATTVDLLRHPTPHFPDDAIPEPVATAIYQRTGGQPYLVHLYGHILVDHLNDAKRKHAEPADMEPVEQEVVRQATTYFGWMVKDCAEEPRRVFLKLAKGEVATISPKHQQALERRGLLTPQGRMAVPVIARWVEENLADED